MNRFKVLAVLFLFVFGVVSSASALSIVNGSFETGDLTGWSEILGTGGSTAVQTSYFDGDSGTTFTATDGEYFANLTATAYIAQNQSWSAGQELTFDWAFDANDYMPFNDFAVFSVLDENGLVIESVTLADVAGLGDYGTTGWNTYTYTFGATGVGSIQFGSVNVLDTALDSNLLLDNISSVPEPITLLLLGPGLLGLAMTSRKKLLKK